MKITYYKKACASQCDGMNEEFMKDIAKGLVPDAEIVVHRGIEKAQEDGIMDLPSLLIDDKLVISGWKPTEKEITKAIKKNLK